MMVFRRNFRAGVFFSRSDLRVGDILVLRRERLRVGKNRFDRRRRFVRFRRVGVGCIGGVGRRRVSSGRVGVCRSIGRRGFRRARTRRRDA